MKSTPQLGEKVPVAKVSHAKNRRFTRVALPKGMLVAWQHSGGRSVSRVSTLGLGGLFIATPDPAPLGAVLKIVFDVPSGEVRARAIVKNIKRGEGMAIAFIEMGYADRARLDQLLKKLT
jgi:PilZ domain